MRLRGRTDAPGPSIDANSAKNGISGPLRPTKTSRLTLLGLLLACALVLGWVERMIPLDAAIPGVRLGLSNAAVLMALYLLPLPDTLALTIGKCVLVNLLTGSVTSLWYSLSGSLLSLCAMLPLARLTRGKVGPVGVSVTGAVFHNIGQLLCASVLLGTFLFPYLPVLLVSGAVTGAAVGTAARYTLPVVKRMTHIKPRK